MVTILCVVWFTCGFMAAGFLNAHLRAEFPDQNTGRDLAIYLLMSLWVGSLMGPFGIVFAMIETNCGGAGFTLSCRPEPESI